MNLKNLSSFQTLSPEKLTKHNVFETKRFFLDVYCVNPGQGQMSHVHPEADKVYIVLDGSCRVTVGSESVDCQVNDAVHCPAGQPHGIENASSQPARLLVLMTPPPPKGP
jgi:mannose-6-phosphate isomerase-like protein (cupin superfamily)